MKNIYRNFSWIVLHYKTAGGLVCICDDYAKLYFKGTEFVSVD
jgi:hypothetical protein